MKLQKDLRFTLKIFLWLITSYILGYILGAIIATQTFGYDAQLLYYGFFLSGYYATVIAGPVFLICVLIYFAINKKQKFDTKISSTIILTLIISIISTLIIMIPLFYVDTTTTILFTIFFFPTWIGTILPRLIIPTLKPGKLTN